MKNTMVAQWVTVSKAGRTQLKQVWVPVSSKVTGHSNAA